MNGILYYSKKKRKKMSKFLMQNIIVVYCACQKRKNFAFGGEKVMNLLRRDYDKICVTVLMNYNPCNIISLPL